MQLSEQEIVRRENLQKIKDLGIDPFPAAAFPVNVKAQEILDVQDSLDELEKLDPRLRQVVECRYFAGYTEQETADALELSVRTVQRSWKAARVWLGNRLGAAAELPETPDT